jgi:hypothetical protein
MTKKRGSIGSRWRALEDAMKVSGTSNERRRCPRRAMKLVLEYLEKRNMREE